LAPLASPWRSGPSGASCMATGARERAHRHQWRHGSAVDSESVDPEHGKAQEAVLWLRDGEAKQKHKKMGEKGGTKRCCRRSLKLQRARGRLRRAMCGGATCLPRRKEGVEVRRGHASQSEARGTAVRGGGKLEGSGNGVAPVRLALLRC
jgi:hypothetical protein